MSLAERDEGERSEYVIHAKLKNNLILSRILASYSNVARFCQETGLRQNEVGNLVNMKCRAVNAEGDWTVAALRLSEALGELPEDLFSEEQRWAQLRTNEAYIEVTRQQALSLVDPVRQLEHREELMHLLSTSNLSANQRAVLTARADDLTLEEIGVRMMLSRERIRQIEAKALRKIRTRVRHEDGIWDLRKKDIDEADPMFTVSMGPPDPTPEELIAAENARLAKAKKAIKLARIAAIQRRVDKLAHDWRQLEAEVDATGGWAEGAT